MKKPELRPFPGQEPKQDKADLAVFDRCNVTRPIKLFDKELPPTIEEWPEPYTLKRRKHLPRPFLSPTGEVVLRLRGGRGFTPIYAPWSPVGLARVRGTALRAPGEWLWYPERWAAEEPGRGPYVLRCNHPLAVNEDAIGPRLDEGEPDPEIKPEFCAERGKGWKPAMARAMHDLELETGRIKGRPLDVGRHVNTSEQRNEAGEYGPETKLTRDGRVVFGKNGLPVYSTARGGAWRDRPRRANPAKPGRKPVYGVALSDRQRKAKQRCKERGRPFVIERYVKEKEPA